MLGKVSLLGQFSGELSGLSFGRNLTSEEQPEHTLSDDLLASWSGGKLLLAIGDRETVEADTLEVGGITGLERCLRSECYTSRGSKTEASQSMALMPRIPPITFSTYCR